jgi:YHS domain-containing protein
MASNGDTLCEYFEAGIISMQQHSNHTNDTELTDPVCGMKVTVASAHKHHHASVDYYYCCQGCQQKFSQNPDYYLSDAAREPQQAVPGAVYICPRTPRSSKIIPVASLSAAWHWNPLAHPGSPPVPSIAARCTPRSRIWRLCKLEI